MIFNTACDSYFMCKRNPGNYGSCSEQFSLNTNMASSHHAACSSTKIAGQSQCHVYQPIDFASNFASDTFGI